VHTSRNGWAPRRTPEGAIRTVRYWFPVIAGLSLLFAGALLVGLLTGAWGDEPKNIARWIGVVMFTVLGIGVTWARVLAMREIRSGRYPRTPEPDQASAHSQHRRFDG
jgi:protein-S-isoprenylcysteine O-methyltransferase Ste14